MVHPALAYEGAQPAVGEPNKTRLGDTMRRIGPQMAEGFAPRSLIVGTVERDLFAIEVVPFECLAVTDQR